MREKAEQGLYPGRAPFGYRNNPLTRAVDVDEQRAPILRRIFELYATGNYSLTSLRKAVLEESGARITRSYLERMLKNPFYIGRFVWRGVEYKGTHKPLISADLFQRSQEAVTGRHKSKFRKHNFAFAGLLRCAHDGCIVTTELQKGQYIYYRCSHGRGRCSLPYMREEDLSDWLGELLKRIYVPETIVRGIVDSLESDLGRSELRRQAKLAALHQRLSMVRTRMDQIYEDRLEGKIDESFWTRKQAEYREQERALEAELSTVGNAVLKQNVLTAARIFELANKAHFLYLTRNSAERGQLLKSVLLNCVTDGVNLSPTYRKPFDLIFERAKTEDWSGREDLNLRPPGPEPGALPG